MTPDYATDFRPLPALPAGGRNGAELEEGPSAPEGRKLRGGSILDFSRRTVNQADTLLGHRYLCRGAGLLFVAPSGQGKSSFCFQASALWGAGREAFGIHPPAAVRSVILQAEDDEGDCIEMAAMLNHLGLSPAETERVGQNTHVERVNDSTGPKALQAADQVLAQRPADLLWLNTLSNYCGCDTKNEEKMGHFLYEGLNALAAKHRCGVVAVAQTPKTNFRDTSNWKPSDWMYSASGSFVLTAWARAVLVIDPTAVPGTFRFIAAKRGHRIGWDTPDRYFAYSKVPGQILWVNATAEEIASAKGSARGGVKNVDLEQVLKLVPVLDPVLAATLERQIGERLGIGEKKVRNALRELEHQQKIHRRKIPNPGKGRSFAGWAQNPEPEA